MYYYTSPENLTITLLCKTTDDEPIHSITCADNGTIYYTLRDSVWSISSHGSNQELLEHSDSAKPTSQFGGVYWHRMDNLLYICDREHDIYVYSIDEEESRSLSDYYPWLEQKKFPKAIGLTFTEQLWVACSDDTLLKIDLDTGKVETVVKDIRFRTSCVITRDYVGRIFLVDSFAVTHFSQTLYSTEPVIGQLSNPTAVCTYPDGFLVVDSGRLTIGQYSPRSPIALPSYVESVASIYATDLGEDILIGTYTGQLFKVQKSWSLERLLWIAHLKEDSSYCGISLLPRDVIRVICFWLHDGQIESACVGKDT